jgi:hypothetical protein
MVARLKEEWGCLYVGPGTVAEIVSEQGGKLTEQEEQRWDRTE